MAAFCLVFFLAGSAMLYFMTIRPLAGVAGSSDWKETPCTVLSSEIEVNEDTEGDTYQAVIKYEYAVNNKRHEGDRYSFMGSFRSSGRSGKEAIVRKYPKGAKRVCYVDPDDPNEAVLNPNLTTEMWWGVFPLPFFLSGAAGLYFTLRGDRKKQDTAATTDNFSAPADRNAAMLATVGPVELKPSLGRSGKLIGIFIFAVFWNGIVSVFVYQVVQEFSWLLALFLVPFVLVGLSLIGGVLHSFGAMFNPHPSLTLSRGAIPLGEAAQLRWQFAGSTRVIQRLKISLRGQEKATYRRGTDTVTSKEVFFEDVLTDAQGMMPEISEGTVDVQIPADLMHSFKSDNNAIEWTIILHGDIPLRPDVKFEFPITVSPNHASH